MNKLLPALILLLAFSALSASAQKSTYQPAYILQHTDTIHGYINSGSDLELSKSIQFKKDLNGEVATTFNPAEIAGFGFEDSGFYYASIKADIRKDSSAWQTERFAKRLLRGYTDLYKLPIPPEEQSMVLQRSNEHLYVLKKDHVFYTLGLYETLKNNLLKTDKRYIGILRAVFNDCENHKDNLDKLSFNDKSIMAEVIKYNLCKRPDEQTEVQEHKSKTIVKHGVEGTFANTFTPENPNDYQAQGYSAGYFWDITFPDKSRRYSGKLGIGYMYYKYSYKEGREEIEVADVAHFVRLPLSVQYNFKDALITNLNPFILVGLTTLVPLNGESSEIVPLQSLGFGIYHGRMRYAFQIENQGFNLSDIKILNLSVGVRLNQ